MLLTNAWFVRTWSGTRSSGRVATSIVVRPVLHESRNASSAKNLSRPAPRCCPRVNLYLFIDIIPFICLLTFSLSRLKSVSSAQTRRRRSSSVLAATCAPVKVVPLSWKNASNAGRRSIASSLMLCAVAWTTRSPFHPAAAAPSVPKLAGRQALHPHQRGR